MKKHIVKRRATLLKNTAFSTLFAGILIVSASCGSNDKKDDEGDKMADISSVRENNGTVESYVSFVNADTATMTLDHSYTSDALKKLSSAVDAMAGEAGFDVKADLEKVKVYADKIIQDPSDISHADTIKMATGLLATALKNMQKAKYAGLSADADDLVMASKAIDPDKLTLDQREAVKSFFSKAAGLLSKMN